MRIAHLTCDGLRDLRDGLTSYELWSFMGWQDIRQRYRRTILGPWWLAISTGAIVLILGFMWAEIFRMEVKEFLPFFVVGYVLWTFLSGLINEATTAFTQFQGLILQRRIPLSAYIYRIAMRHVIILGHNAVVVVLLLLWFDPQWSVNNLVVLPALVVFVAATVTAAIPIAIFCTRFRDFPQIVTNVLQVAFFATPIMYRPESLVRFRFLADYNPFAHLIEIVRAPMLGRLPAMDSWIWAVAATIVSILAGAWLLGRYGHRVAFWL